MSQLSFEGEKRPESVVMNGPNLPAEPTQDAVDGQSDKISDEGISSDNDKPESENSMKTVNSSDSSEMEDGKTLPSPQGKPGASPQSGLLDIEVSSAAERNISHQSNQLEPANQESKTAGNHPESSHLENLAEERFANGSLDSPTQFTGNRSKRDSDSGSTSASESMDLTISLSGDLSLNRESGSGSMSLKVRMGSHASGGAYVQLMVGATEHSDADIRRLVLFPKRLL